MAVAAGSVISDAEIVGELRAAWAEVSRGYARCWAAMAEVARRTTTGWESTEIAAALTFTARRADYELGCAVVLVERLPRVYAALAAGELDHHKARVFCDYLSDVTPAQAERICERLVPLAPGWTTGQLATRLLREVHAIDPDYTRQTYQRAVRERAVHGYLDHTGTAVLTGSGLPAADTAAAAARLETLAADLRAGGYPATINQTRADLYLRLLDGTLDGLTHQQILATMLQWGPIPPADDDPGQHRTPSEPDHQPQKRPPVTPDQPTPANEPDQPEPAKGPCQPEPDQLRSAQPECDQPERDQPGSAQPECDQPGSAQPECDQPECDQPGSDQQSGAEQSGTGGPGQTATRRAVRYGIEVRVRLSTLLGLDEHPAELPGWGPLPAADDRDLVAVQHKAECASRSSTPTGTCSTVRSSVFRTPLRELGRCRSGEIVIRRPGRSPDHDVAEVSDLDAGVA